MTRTRDVFGHELDFGVRIRVGAPRQDGRYPAQFTFRRTGRTARRVLTRAGLDAAIRRAIARGDEVVGNVGNFVDASAGAVDARTAPGGSSHGNR